MKKNTMIVLGSILAMVLIFGGGFIASFNSIATSKEATAAAFANVESQYQRRADLIPNLVKIVEQAVTSEKDLLKSVVDARAKATSISIDPSNATQEQLNQYQNAQGELGASLGKLLAISESYPELKSIQGFTDLQVQVEGTENRITVARNDFNTAVKSYNSKIVTFPRNIVASMGGYQKLAYFEAKAGSSDAPDIEFGAPNKIPVPDNVPAK